MSLNIGDRAPDFELPDQDGTPVSLASLLAQGPVVIFFYPKAGSPVCTMEACSFRDARDELGESGAQVVGVSADPVGALARFAAKRSLGYRLLSDADASVRKSYGATGPMGMGPGRVTFVIDAGGIVRHVGRSMLRASSHVSGARRALQALAGSRG